MTDRLANVVVYSVMDELLVTVKVSNSHSGERRQLRTLGERL